MSDNFKKSLSKELIDKFASQNGFVKRSSKLEGRHFVEMLMFANLNAIPVSLNDLSAYLLEEHQIAVSKQGVDNRFNVNAVDFLKGLLSAIMKENLQIDIPEKAAHGFKSMRIKDSTKWNLLDNCSKKYKGHGGYRAKSSAMISVQYEYDLLNGDIIDLSLNPGTRNDLQDSKQVRDNIEENDLLIRDLGYISMGYLENVVDKKAYFLNKMPPQLGVYKQEDQSKKEDFVQIAKLMKNKNLPYLDREVLVGYRKYLKCRMVVIRVPDNIYKQKLSEAKKKAKQRGHGVSDEYKARAMFNVYLTNVAQTKVPPEIVAELYRVRWQIELIFKVWKSLVNVNRLSQMKQERFECQLLGKLIWLMVNWKVFSVINGWMHQNNKENRCSVWKFFKQVRRKTEILRDVIWNGVDIEKWLMPLFIKAESHLKLEKRKGKIPLSQIYNHFCELA